MRLFAEGYSLHGQTIRKLWIDHNPSMFRGNIMEMAQHVQLRHGAVVATGQGHSSRDHWFVECLVDCRPYDSGINRSPSLPSGYASISDQ